LQPVRYTRMGFTPAECAGQGTFDPYDPVHIGSLSAPLPVDHRHGGLKKNLPRNSLGTRTSMSDYGFPRELSMRAHIPTT
jgi:hypothetical protein